MFKFFLTLFLLITSKSYSSVSNINQKNLSSDKIVSVGIADGLTYKDLYRDHITVDQKWELLKKLRSGDLKFAKKVYLSCLNSMDWVLRSGGVQFLATIDPELARLKAIELFKNDPALLVRSTALQVLERVGAQKYKKEFWAALTDSKNFHKGQSLWIRKEIAKNLYALSEGTDMTRWSSLLNDSDSYIVNFSIKALEKNSGVILGHAGASDDAKAKLWKDRFNLY